jgi:hypothetical protein
VGVCSLVVAAILGGGYLDRTNPTPPPVTCSPGDGDARVSQSAQLLCVSGPRTDGSVRVPKAVGHVVDVATLVAVLLSGLLTLGLLRTWVWPTVPMEENADPDDDI